MGLPRFVLGGIKRLIDHILVVNPSHSLANLFGIRVYAIAGDTSDQSFVPVSSLNKYICRCLKTHLGQRLLGMLPEWLVLLRRVYFGKADLYWRLVIAARSQGVAISYADDQTSSQQGCAQFMVSP